MNKLTKTEKSLLANYIMAISLSVLTVVCAIFKANVDISSLATITVTWIGETAVFTGFYCWKEKNANRQKYAMKWVREIKDEFPPEVAARFAEIVLKE